MSERKIYRGEEGEVIPRETTHVIVENESIRVILERAFDQHPNIVEVICHDKVEKVERLAFALCPSLRRVIMRGVKIAEDGAFDWCKALTDVECGKLEILKERAFSKCWGL